MASPDNNSNHVYPVLPKREQITPDDQHGDSQNANTHNDTQQLLKKTENTAHAFKKNIKEPTSNLFVTILNMVKLMIGSGMLSLPWAFSHVGLYPGIIAAVFCALFDFIAAMFLIYSSEITGIFEYSALLRLIGPIWEYAGALTLLYVVSGSLIGYLILIGDFVGDALIQLGLAEDAIPAQRQVIIIIFTVFILTPLVLLKDLSSLRFSSFIGIAAIAYCVLLLIITAVIHLNDPEFILGNANNNDSFFESMNWNIGFFIMTNVCTQAYVCHYSVQRVYLDLKQRSIKRMWIANGVSYLIVCILYIIFAICGYVLYGSKCPSDVLIAFVGDVDVVVARFAMTFSVCGTYPLAFVACQAAIEDKFFNQNKNRVWNYSNKPYLRKIIIVITQVIYLILACIIPTIGPVVSINGAVSTIGLIALFPIAASWKIGFSKDGFLNTQFISNTMNYLSFSSSGRNNKYTELDELKHENDEMIEINEKSDVAIRTNHRSLTTKILLSVMLVIGVVFGVMGLITTVLTV